MTKLYVAVEEETNSTGRNSTFKQVWHADGYASNSAVRTAIQGHADYNASVTTADGYVLDYVAWNYNRQVSTSRKVIKVTLTYSHQESNRNKSGNKPLQEIGDEETVISYSTIEVPILESKQTQSAKGNSKDVGNRIEYNSLTGEVRGTTRKKLVSHLQVTKIIAEATITNAWIVEREDKMHTLNNATFRGRDAETVMFSGMGPLTQRTKNGDYHVSFNFDYMAKETLDLSTLDIGSASTIDIYPWRYYWAAHDEEKDATAKEFVPKTTGFYESFIYDTADFSTIIP